jgi:serine/threonine protein phosphatase 1
MSPQAITPTAPVAPSGSPTSGNRPAPGPSPAIDNAAPASPSPRHWVISDVHGCADALHQLVGLLPADDRVVLCGDVINRGPRIEAAMELAWHLVASGRGVWLMGNHEQRLVQQLRGEAWGERHLLAGSDTYRQLGSRSCRRWLERLEQLPLVHWGQGWSATHAGFDPLTWQPHLTVRMAFWQHYDGRFGTVIVGHTPGPQVRRIRDIVLIDTGACYGGPLTAYCAETGEERAVAGLPAPGHSNRTWTTGAPERLAGSLS